MPYTDLKLSATCQCRDCGGKGVRWYELPIRVEVCDTCDRSGRETVQVTVEELAGLLASTLPVNP